MAETIRRRSLVGGRWMLGVSSRCRIWHKRVSPSSGGIAAQVRAGIKRPIRWHDLRHQFVSPLIAAGKNPLYIAQQAGHADAGFSLKRYGHLFKTIKPTPVEWPEDLLWPLGCAQNVTVRASNRPQEVGRTSIRYEHDGASIARRRTQKTNQPPYSPKPRQRVRFPPPPPALRSCYQYFPLVLRLVWDQFAVEMEMSHGACDLNVRLWNTRSTQSRQASFSSGKSVRIRFLTSLTSCRICSTSGASPAPG